MVVTGRGELVNAVILTLAAATVNDTSSAAVTGP